MLVAALYIKSESEKGHDTDEKEIGSGGRGFDGEIRCLRPYTQLKEVLSNISISMDFSDA